jgi:hypothetical protein
MRLSKIGSRKSRGVRKARRLRFFAVLQIHNGEGSRIVENRRRKVQGRAVLAHLRAS